MQALPEITGSSRNCTPYKLIHNFMHTIRYKLKITIIIRTKYIVSVQSIISFILL